MGNDIYIITSLLIVFYMAVIMYHSSNFQPVVLSNSKKILQPVVAAVNHPEFATIKKTVKPNYEQDVYETQDTRMQYPELPPVNPNARNLVVLDNVRSSQDLYSNQGSEINYGILNVPPAQNVNELVYSGGMTQLIKIPLQYNDPYNEQLRTQDILITPYNKIKYTSCQ